VAFLDKFRTGGPWVLTAIPNEGGRTDTATFNMANVERLIKWLESHEERGNNVYFMVNPARGPLSSKAKKEDVEALEYLHVDIDPRKGETWEAAKPRALKALEDFKPSPTFIVDSGGGVQAFWRLDDAVHVGGDPVRIADLEAYNQQLEKVLGGDHCFNIDRVMRLPGTVNFPNQKKVAKGRIPFLAKLLTDAGTEHPLYDFTAAPRVQQDSGAIGGGAKVQLSGNLPSVNVMTDLPEHVTQRTRMLIVQGDDPDDPTKYQSKSEVCFAVCCELVRANVADDIIAAILLDPDYAVSEHVTKQRRPVEYAARQIQRAKEEVEEPLLRKMNEAHAVIADIGGKCRVISEVLDTSLKRPRSRVSKQSFEDFRNRYMHMKVQVGTTKEGAPIYKPAGKWWLEHQLRRQYETMVFAPRREVPDAYNLWRGFACDALPGDQHQPYLKHLLDNICSGNEEHYHYVIHWLARCVQQPDEQGEVAIVLRGGQGTGKGTFINGFGSLWGRHYLQVSSAKHLVGQFNAHLRDCVVLFADEAFFAGDKQHESVLKTLITEDTVVVEGKGVDAEIGPNFTHLLMAGNGHWLVPAGMDERRFLVMDVGDGQKQSTVYFKEIRRAMDNGGRENLLHFLMSLDLADFDVRKVPQTDALRDQKLFSMSVEEQWWMERLMDGRTTASSNEWHTSVMKERLHQDYLRYAEAQKIMRRVSPTALGKFLSRVLDKPFPVSSQKMATLTKTDAHGMSYEARERAYFYELPSLENARASWDKRYAGGSHFDWPKDDVPEPKPDQGMLDNAEDPY
jgi:hypothetical protein